MLKRASSAIALIARLVAISSVLMLGLVGPPAWSAPKDIRWGTGPVGSSGHKALVVLADLLNKAMPDYRITVLPTPGAVTTVKGFATNEFDGYYGSDVALKELATDSGRFKGFKSHIQYQPIQSLWCYTIDVGLGIKSSDRGTIKRWEDLSGKPVYTGPLPFDTRKYLENAMAAVGVHHVYRQIDLSTVGSQLSSGSIKAMIIYVAGGETPPPWLAEASLAVDWTPLNPSPDEAAKLTAEGFKIEAVDPAKIGRKNTSLKEVTLLPFYWGFDLGLNMPTDDMEKMLTIIDQHADELAALDPSFRQIAGGKMAQFQKQALQSTWKLAPIHPGLAKFLKGKHAWDAQWDSNVAEPAAGH